VAPAGAPAHRRPCVNSARQSPPLVHVRVYIHIDIHIPANSSPSRQTTTRYLSRSRGAVGRARPWSFQPGVGSQPAERSRGAGRAEARRPKRGTWKGTAEENAPSKRTNYFDAVHPHAMRVSRCQYHSTPCLSAARASRGDRGYRMSRLLLASELLWVGVASEPLALRSVGDGVSALQRCVTGCSRAQRCPAHMLKDMDPITGQMQSSQRHSRLARRLQYAEARRVSSRNGL
jgi:hypothetical protein